jgi:hypothetical protein
MQRWEAPPNALQPGSALVFANRLPTGLAHSSKEDIARYVSAETRRHLGSQGYRVITAHGVMSGENIAWVAFWFPREQTKALYSGPINSKVQGTFSARRRHWGIGQIDPAVLIYLAPGKVPADDAEMREQIWLVSALRSVLTWEEFRAAVAVGLFGRLSLATNVRSRTPHTGFGDLRAGAEAAANAPALAAAALQLAQSAVPVAEAMDAAGAHARLTQARASIQEALQRIDDALRVGPEVQAKATAALAGVPVFVRAAVAATHGRITEREPIKRQYMECRIWEWANEKVQPLQTRFRNERDQAPRLLALLQANAEAARAALEAALQQIDEIATRVEDILGPWWGRPLGPLPVWAWGAIGVTAFLGGAGALRRARKKRPRKNRARRRTTRRRAQ